MQLRKIVYFRRRSSHQIEWDFHGRQYQARQIHSEDGKHFHLFNYQEISRHHQQKWRHSQIPMENVTLQKGRWSIQNWVKLGVIPSFLPIKFVASIIFRCQRELTTHEQNEISHLNTLFSQQEQMVNPGLKNAEQTLEGEKDDESSIGNKRALLNRTFQNRKSVLSNEQLLFTDEVFSVFPLVSQNFNDVGNRCLLLTQFCFLMLLFICIGICYDDNVFFY